VSSSIRLGAAMIALATLLAACGSTTDQSPGVTPTASATATPTATATPSATPTPTPTLTPGPPSAPTDFTIVLLPDYQPCPSAVPTLDSNLCAEFDFSWHSTEGPDVWFRIFSGATGEGDLTCADLQASSDYWEMLTTAPGARDAQWFQSGIGTGGGTYCYWLVATNSQGSSAMVLGSGWQ
jgi:hypothetical protein